MQGHKLWNAARYLCDLFDSKPSLVRGRNVLELGAGAGAPSLIAALVSCTITELFSFDQVLLFPSILLSPLLMYVRLIAIYSFCYAFIPEWRSTG